MYKNIERHTAQTVVYDLSNLYSDIKIYQLLFCQDALKHNDAYRGTCINMLYYLEFEHKIEYRADCIRVTTYEHKSVSNHRPNDCVFKLFQADKNKL